MSPKDFPALSTLNRIAFAPAPKSYRVRLLFTLKNDDFGAISLTSGEAPRRSGKWTVTYRSGSELPGSRKTDWNLGVTSGI